MLRYSVVYRCGEQAGGGHIQGGIYRGMQLQVEQAAQNLAVTYQLGSLRKEYKPGTTCGIIALVVIALPLTLTFTFGLVYVAMFLVGSSNGIIALLIALAGALIGCLLLFGIVRGIRAAYRTRHSRTLLYDDGLIWITCADEQITGSEAVHWRDIAVIWHEVTVTTSTTARSDGTTSTTRQVSHKYMLQRHDGSRVTNVVKDSKLGEIIEQGTLPYLLPPAQNAFYQGQPLTRGPLTLTTAGLQYNNKILPWQEFEKATISSEGTITLRKHGKLFAWVSFSCNNVPNAAMLLALLMDIRGKML